ncbi:283_t:CDS:2 [Entrophospora sp. SA101]|nr:8869_t:CDS:2 [Entrophospora sp. SA101]CAJ0907387.1 283_t:CDS:2 [Entrophospora sp. SA101]
MPVSTTVIPIPSITDENSSTVIIQDSIPPHSITDNDDDSPISTSKSTKDINHDVFKHIMNDNFISPIDKPTMKNCLDIGFGSGIWMMEVASCGDKTLNVVTKLLNEKQTNISMELTLQDIFKKNGFSSFKNIKVNIPMGKWAGMVGELYLSAFKLLLTTTSNTPPTNDEFKIIEAECDDHKTSFVYHAGFAKRL